MLTLTLFFGAIVGISLGLSGGGGAIFAVPLLVFGLAVEPAQAVLVSLVAVGSTAFVGFLHRWVNGQVDFFTGSVFAVGGMAGAPFGAYVGGRMSEALLLGLFAGLLLVVSLRLWATSRVKNHTSNDEASAKHHGLRDYTGSRVSMLIGSGVITGILSGVFGVGGGFIVVPVLLLTTHMGMRCAVATSLMVITITSGAAIGSFVLLGQSVPWEVAVPFMAGGIVGLSIGTLASSRISGPRLQQAFALATAGIAVFTLIETLHT